VIVTDYPDANLIENLAHNVAVNLEAEERRRIDVQVGYSRLAFSMFFYCKDFDRDMSGASPFIPY
jgi:hypothetical protein